MKSDAQFLTALLNCLPEQIAVMDVTGVILYVNQSWINFGVKNGVAPEYSWIGVNYLFVCHEGFDDIGIKINNTTYGIFDVIKGKIPSYEADYPCFIISTKKTTKERWFKMHFAKLPNLSESLYIVTHSDISERKLSEDRVTLLSMRDALTGLSNRRHLNDFIKAEWIRGMRTQKKLSVLMIDIDFFKEYNDAFGHIIGDNCICQVSDTIKKIARRPYDLAARFGGEEFVVVFGETELVQAVNFAKSLCKKISDLNILHTQNRLVTVSIGVSSMQPDNKQDETVILNQADSALYMAKKNGRNRVEVFEI